MSDPTRTERVKVIDAEGRVVDEYDRPVEDEPERGASATIDVPAMQAGVTAAEQATTVDDLRAAVLGIVAAIKIDADSAP